MMMVKMQWNEKHKKKKRGKQIKRNGKCLATSSKTCNLVIQQQMALTIHRTLKKSQDTQHRTSVNGEFALSPIFWLLFEEVIWLYLIKTEKRTQPVACEEKRG